MKRLLLVSTLLLSVLFANSQTAEEFSNMAEKKQELKDYQYAMVLINKAIVLDDKNYWYHLKKAEIQFELAGPVEAIKIIKTAIPLNKNESEAYSRAGYYYDSSGQNDSAIFMYNEAIKYAANDTIKYSYIMNRGAARLGGRDFKGAVKDFEEVLVFDPNNIGTLNNIAPCYRELGMTDKGIAALKKLIVIDPTFLGTYVNLGFVYSQIDSFDLAISYFDKAQQMDPNDALVYNNRGYVFYKKGDFPSALKDINLSIKMYPTNSYAYRNLALVYIAMNKTIEACSALAFARDYGFESRYGPEVKELIYKHCK